MVDVKKLIALGSDKDQLQAVERAAARKLLKATGIEYPHDGCAITIACLLQSAGYEFPNVYRAIDLGNILKQKGWQTIDVGKQAPGDIGSTCGKTAKHGVDHVYLVLKLVNHDEMVIADNQAKAPHFRWASGKGGKSPTRLFLRAPVAAP